MNVQNEVEKQSKVRLIALGSVLVLVLAYLGWSLLGSRGQQPGDGFKPTEQAVDTPKVAGPALTVPLRVMSKQAVKAKLPGADLDGDGASDDADDAAEGKTEVVDTGIIPPAPHGATTVTIIDKTTGEVTTQAKINEAPWFQFRRTNILEVGADVGSKGRRAAGEYSREIFSVKDAVLVGKVGGKAPLEPKADGEWYVGARIKYSW